MRHLSLAVSRPFFEHTEFCDHMSDGLLQDGFVYVNENV